MKPIFHPFWTAMNAKTRESLRNFKPENYPPPKHLNHVALAFAFAENFSEGDNCSRVIFSKILGKEKL